MEQAVPVKHLDGILNHIESVEDSLICPCGTEDDQDTDLSKLPCGHTISLRAWKQYEIAFRERDTGSKIPCPRCKRPVSNIGKVLPMKGIRRAIGEVKENCEWLKGQLTWDGPNEDYDPTAENEYENLLEEEEPVNFISGSVPSSESIMPPTMASSSSSRIHYDEEFSELDYSKGGGSANRNLSRTPSPRARTATSEGGTRAAVRARTPP